MLPWAIFAGKACCFQGLSDLFGSEGGTHEGIETLHGDGNFHRVVFQAPYQLFVALGEGTDTTLEDFATTHFGEQRSGTIRGPGDHQWINTTLVAVRSFGVLAVATQPHARLRSGTPRLPARAWWWIHPPRS